MKKFSRLIIVLFLMQLMFLSGCNSPNINSNTTVENPVTDTYIIYISEEVGIVAKTASNGNELIVLPNTPTRNGYHFGGWFFDNTTFVTKFDNLSLLNITMKEDLKVYAKWITENEFKLIELNEEKKELEEDLELAYLECNYSLNIKNAAYKDYINKTDRYNNIYVKKIRVYRNGGYVYVDDPDDIQWKQNAKVLMDDAKEYYEVCLAIYEVNFELYETYSSKYEDLLLEIEALSD